MTIDNCEVRSKSCFHALGFQRANYAAIDDESKCFPLPNYAAFSFVLVFLSLGLRGLFSFFQISTEFSVEVAVNAYMLSTMLNKEVASFTLQSLLYSEV